MEREVGEVNLWSGSRGSKGGEGEVGKLGEKKSVRRGEVWRGQREVG